MPVSRGLVLAAVAAILGGCGSTFSGMPGIGLPAETPPAPAAKPDYPSVGESGGRRDRKAFTAEERVKQETELAKRRAEAAAKKRQEIEQSSQR